MTAQFARINADRPACLILVGLHPKDARAADGELRHGELANLAAIHAAAFKATAVVGQYGGETAIVVPDLNARTAPASLPQFAEAMVKDAGRLGLSIQIAIGRVVPGLRSLRSTAGETASILRCLRRNDHLTVGTLEDFETEIVLDEAVAA
ncbi:MULTISPECIES: hypothetical protein [Arthrobacter]|uniref:CdaR GGDEF-like domain-containing protein n=2 Tax=Arthrobacter TaxID=1663 RepID=A0ABU9KGY0_9MICC|nr:hypothetical protein [Arthrobacter sp. YJM1]MDP5226146.1 hypothetical protein [Arthrobacter sp. YJM1]